MFCKRLSLRFAVPAFLSKILYSELKSLKMNRRIRLFKRSSLSVRSFLPDYLQLSMSCHWCFTNLNVAFRAVVGDPTRSLHVYSDVAGSTIVGNRVTDLLREIQYKRQGRGTLYFEPLHIQYMSLRNEVVEMIHVQVAETIGRGGDLVKFGEGHTIVTLHFKKT